MARLESQSAVEDPTVELITAHDASVEATGQTIVETPRGRAWLPVRDAPPAYIEDEDPVTFSDLVRAHRGWEQALYEQEHHPRRQGPGNAIEEAYRVRRRKFERCNGEIHDAYWSIRDASAVALTIRKKSSRRWRPDGELIPRFHRATDWATLDEPEIAEALDDCETLAVKAEEILRGASELIALRRIYAVASHVLGFVDREWGRQPPGVEDRSRRDEILKAPRKAFVARQREELASIDRFYNRAGNRQARIVFFWGMAHGLIALLLLTGLAVALIAGMDRLDGAAGHWPELQLFMISVAAGALGGVLSVLSRMASLTGKFDLDHEVGRKCVRWLGVYRPLVGGIFGLATFLVLASGILQTQSPGAGKDFAYYGTLALFSGFFERFMKLAPGGVPTPLEEVTEEGKA